MSAGSHHHVDTWHRDMCLQCNALMDPNRALADMRAALKRVDAATTDSAQLSALSDVAIAADALDRWLSRGGGFLPDAWFTGTHRDKH